MTQIIQFPALDIGYPTMAADLGTAGCVLLIAVRWWVEGYRRDEDAMPRLLQGLEMAGAPAAAASIQAMMEAVARSVQRPLEIHAPRCPCLSDDERRLLHAAELAQSGNAALAEKALRTALLSAQGAEVAIVPLTGIGAFFAAARLHFSRHRRGETDPRKTELESWVPTPPSNTLH